ncbi:M81 family metallopeptidase [Dubosiella newyorkensis]|uniref:M81 family metallopeptidase n=2 Tax=Dubosiella newyorkensis TaxID=1862672 RepID=UPI002357088D|nr:M81 family metallopeptidase [Dubosiella newyorkensis]
MNILVAKFQLEANEHVPMKCDMEDVALSFGEESLKHMQLGDVFEDPDIHVIPTLCADAACSGVMKKECFDYIESYILRAIKENIQSIDGIYLHLHGASYVEEIGSGDHHIVKSIREIVGPYLPIAISCDPHGNLTKEYIENATYIRSYRQAPHTDIAETVQKTCQTLIDLIHHRKNIKPIYRKLPLILGGEQSVSTDEPVRSINQYLDELEKDERILSASWHVGYLRHDCPEAGCGIIVIPNDEKDKDYASEVADRLARYVWDKRHEFHYTGLTLDPEETVKRALQFEDKPVFITDSGDNVTSGAMGANTFILHQFLEQPNLEKKVLFASINDPKSKQILENANIGDEVDIKLGMGIDALTTPCDVEVEVKYKGRQEGTYMYGEEGDYGGLVTIHIKDTNIDVVVTDNNHSFVEKHQIDACGVDWDDYDIIVVKQGYIHPELKEKGKLNIMSLTNGATPQDTRLIPFKRIMRPMYPIDEI